MAPKVNTRATPQQHVCNSSKGGIRLTGMTPLTHVKSLYWQNYERRRQIDYFRPNEKNQCHL
jgi:hypothetical protein